MRFRVCALALFCAAGAAAQNVSIFISSPPVVDAGLPFQYKVSYLLTSLDDASGVINVELPPGFVFRSGKHCGTAGPGVQCPAFPGFDEFTIDAIAPDIREGGSFVTRATITLVEKTKFSVSSASQTALVPTFVVENTNDAGPGSLRAAIESTNAACHGGVGCTIAFRLGAPPSNGFHTIAPLTPLPDITASSLAIDGTTQTRSPAGDTNPDGPEVFLDGSQVTGGNAITLAGCAEGVGGLAIGNFPGAAIKVPASVSVCRKTILSNYLGVDPSGLRAAPNERGVFADQAIVDITNNLISGNRRSGVFLVDRVPDPTYFDQTSSPKIRGNTIGLDRNHQPMGNGASGVYVDGTAVLRDNYIAFNHDFGVAIANGSGQSAVDVQVNSIFANWQMGIDIDLDGARPNAVPVIRSARYDPATNRTLIELGTGARRGNLGLGVTIYASDAPHASGYGDGQYLLGDVFSFPVEPGGFATFSAIGDWRGKWVSATQTNRWAYEQFYVPIANTSEFSKAVKVE